MRARSHRKHTRAYTSYSPSTRTVLAALFLLLPLLMGGCPEYRDSVVGAIDRATRSVVLTDTEHLVAYETARDSIIDSTIGLFFEQLLSENR